MWFHADCKLLRAPPLPQETWRCTPVSRVRAGLRSTELAALSLGLSCLWRLWQTRNAELMDRIRELEASAGSGGTGADTEVITCCAVVYTTPHPTPCFQSLRTALSTKEEELQTKIKENDELQKVACSIAALLRRMVPVLMMPWIPGVQ